MFVNCFLGRHEVGADMLFGITTLRYTIGTEYERVSRASGDDPVSSARSKVLCIISQVGIR